MSLVTWYGPIVVSEWQPGVGTGNVRQKMETQIAAVAASYRVPSSAERAEFVARLVCSADAGRMAIRLGGKLYAVDSIRVPLSEDWFFVTVRGVESIGWHFEEIQERLFVKPTFGAPEHLPVSLPWFERGEG